jgi:general secretion pathway protein G
MKSADDNAFAGFLFGVSSSQLKNLPLRKGCRMKAKLPFFILLAVVLLFAVTKACLRPNDVSRTAVAKVQIEELEGALQLFALDTLRYPTTAEGLNALMRDPGNVRGWKGPYLRKSLPRDPWGRAFVYRCPGEHGRFDIYSYGRDGAPGGEKDDADIVNWDAKTPVM